MKIAIGGDHAAFEMKNELAVYLKEKGYDVADCGCFSADSVDYPDIAKEVSGKVVSGEAGCGVLLCGTGIGISIAANKIKGVRCGLMYNEETAVLAKEHNNANIVALGARTNTLEHAKRMLDAYLGAEFLGGRHERRIQKIDQLDEQ